jgi:predicted dehydrogenase
MIRFGIVGAGRIARKFAEDIQVVNDAKVVAIASRSMERAKSFQADFSLEYAFDSYEKMAKSGLIDAVYIATPHNFHKDHSILFLQHKIPVICEKPISVNSTELAEMIQVAKENNTLLMEAMWTRFLPVTKFLLKIIQENKLGKIQHMDISFGFDLMKDANEEGRIMNPNLAGGSLLDVGIYPVTYQYILNGNKYRKQNSKAEFYHNGIDLRVETSLEYQNKSTAHLICAIDEFLDNIATIVFENGTVVIPNFWSAQELVVNNEVIKLPHKSGGFEYQIESFIETIQKGQVQNDLVPHQHSIDVMEVMDQIRQDIGLKYPFEK